MVGKSTLRYLPKEIYREIDRLLSEDILTLDEIVEHLRGLGIDTVSRSTLGRRKLRIGKVLERIRQSREFAEVIAQKLGPEAVEGKTGRGLVQMIQALAGEYMMRRLEDPDGEADIKELLSLARTVKDAAQASRNSQDFELKIREQVAKEAQAKMEKAVTAVVGNPELAHLSREEAAERIRAIYRGEE